MTGGRTTRVLGVCERVPTIVPTPLGWVGTVVSDEGVMQLALPVKDKKTVERALQRAGLVVVREGKGHGKKDVFLRKTVKLLEKYFTGQRVLFDIPLDLRYHTTFQRSVWKAAATIPYGETRSYAWIANRIGNPKAARAVGQALGANPVPIVIP